MLGETQFATATVDMVKLKTKMLLPITELALGRFRGLRDIELQGLGSVNLLVGPNNSGKTTVLEAFSLAAEPLDLGEWLQTANRRALFGSPVRSPFAALRWLFPHDANHHPLACYTGSIDLGVSGSTPLVRLRAEYQDLRSLRSPHPLQEIEAAQEPALQQGAVDASELPCRGGRLSISATYRTAETRRESFTWWEDERLQLPPSDPVASIPTRVVTAYDHWFSSLLATQYSLARQRNESDNLIDLLARVDPRIAGAEVVAIPSARSRRRAEAELYLRDTSAGLLPIDAFGVGVHRRLLIALAILQARGGILLIDELETGIHVSALGRTFRWIVTACAENNVQLFATTHSLEAIDALLAADDTPDHEGIVGYRLEPAGNRITARRYGEDLLRRLRMERGLEVR